MEACGGAHFLGRALREQGHDVRLMPAQYVKPYIETCQGGHDRDRAHEPIFVNPVIWRGLSKLNDIALGIMVGVQFMDN